MSLDTKNIPKKSRRQHRNGKFREAWERSKHERNVAAGPQLLITFQDADGKETFIRRRAVGC